MINLQKDILRNRDIPVASCPSISCAKHFSFYVKKTLQTVSKKQIYIEYQPYDIIIKDLSSVLLSTIIVDIYRFFSMIQIIIFIVYESIHFTDTVKNVFRN